MRVLSLFDGISCGRVALERAGIPIETYYASEIDKYAIQISKKNYPDIIQLGDITKINFKNYIGKVDLIIGGSPCQDLSIAGKRKGLSGERSGLFYKFVEALNIIKPKYFLLENNVGIPQDAYEEISLLMGCYPVEINSSSLSAQNRRRYYWTNIGEKYYDLFGFPKCNIPQPKDKGVLLKDVLESGEPYQDKSDCLTARYQGATFPHDFLRNQRTQVAESVLYNQFNEATMKEKSGTFTTASANRTAKRGMIVCTPIRLKNYEKSQGQAQRVYSIKGKSVALNANGGGQGGKTGLYKIDLPDGKYFMRKLKPIEAERLQTLPDGFTAFGINEGGEIIEISDTQRYKCIGNGWTVDVIAHIFSFINKTDL